MPRLPRQWPHRGRRRTFSPWAWASTRLAFGLVLAGLAASPARAASAPIVYISVKNTVIIQAGTAHGLAVDDEVCFAVKRRQQLGCAAVKLVRRGLAAVGVPRQTAVRLKTGMVAKYVPSLPGIRSAEPDGDTYAMPPADHVTTMEAKILAREWEAAASRAPDLDIDTATDADIDIATDKSQPAPRQRRVKGSPLALTTIWGVTGGLAQERLAADLAPATFNIAGPAACTRLKGGLYFGSTAAWSLRTDLAAHNFTVALSPRDTSSGPSDTANTPASDVTTKTFSESDLSLALAYALLGGATDKVELGLGGTQRRLPAVLSISASGAPSSGLLALSSPLALLSYTRRFGTHALTLTLNAAPSATGLKASGRGGGASLEFRKPFTSA